MIMQLRKEIYAGENTDAWSNNELIIQLKRREEAALVTVEHVLKHVCGFAFSE